MRGLYNATRGDRPKWYRFRVSSDMKQDPLVWKLFLIKYNGKFIISKEVWGDSFNVHIYSYASVFALGAYYQSNWIQGSFRKSWKSVNIATKELVPVYLAFKLWFANVFNSKVMFHVDNIRVVHMLIIKPLKSILYSLCLEKWFSKPCLTMYNLFLSIIILVIIFVIFCLDCRLPKP